MGWGFDELREGLNYWEEDKIRKANKETRRKGEVGGILPTIREGEENEIDFETQGEPAISDNFGSYGVRAIFQNIGGADTDEKC